MRCAPKPSAAPSTAAGATSDPTGMARIVVTCTITTTNSRATDTQEITEATAWRCFALSDAHQLVAFPVLGVDAPDDPVGAPVDEPGGQQAADQIQRDRHASVENPDADAAAPEAVPALGQTSVQVRCYSSSRLIAPPDSGFEESVDVSVQYCRRIADFVVGAQVLHHLVRVQHVGAHLVPPRAAAVTLQRVQLSTFF